MQRGGRFAWLFALVAGAVALGYAWHSAGDPRRADGNGGHVNIDFAGQWILGRLVVRGHGHHLYERNHQRAVLAESFPRSDVEQIMAWLVGQDDPNAARTLASFLGPLAGPNPVQAVSLLTAGATTWSADRLERVIVPHPGGSLYPPVHAVLATPLALLPPRPAYHLVQVLNLLLIFLDGWLVCRLTGGQVSWPLASFLLMLFPGFAGAINLGQNPVVSLTLLLLGWSQLAAGRPVLGGVLWGFLAFKPVWAAAFFLAALLTRRWRFAAAMLLTGVLLILATLPVVGWRAWFDWLAVGRLAADGYASFESWVFLSRDLFNFFRRWLLHFEDGFATDPDRWLPGLLGAGLWLAVLASTLGIAWRQRRRPVPLTGPAAAFLLLGAWLSCYHFMYYDVLLAALPVCLLFAGRAERGLRVPLVLAALLIGLSLLGANLDPSFHFPPFDTLCLLALWAWCGMTWLRSTEAACIAVQQ